MFSGVWVFFFLLAWVGGCRPHFISVGWLFGLVVAFLLWGWPSFSFGVFFMLSRQSMAFLFLWGVYWHFLFLGLGLLVPTALLFTGTAWYSQYGGDYTGLLDAGVGGGQLHGLGLQAGQVVGQEQQLG